MATPVPTARPPRPRAEVILFAADLAASAASIAAALLLRFRFDVPEEHALPYLMFLPALVGWRVFAAFLAGAYDLRHRLTPLDHLFSGIGAALLGVLGGYVFLVVMQLYYVEATYLSRYVTAIDLVLLTAWFALSRTIALAALHRMGRRVRVAIVGTEAVCAAVAEEIRNHAPRLLELSGIAAVDADASDDAAISDALRRAHADQVVLAPAGIAPARIPALLAACDAAPELFIYPDIELAALSGAPLAGIAGVPVIALQPNLAASPYQYGKRCLDVAASAALLLIGAPLWLLIAAAIRLDSPGPVFFTQERVGLHGRRFRLVKFRTMRPDAESLSGPTLACPDDPRVTRIGAFLRRSRLDEAPQFWNVLRGEMSLVGPRPERPEFVEAFQQETPLYRRRFLMRPGLSGLAQIHGRYDTDYAQKLRYDLSYLNTVSLGLDLRILLATLRTMVSGQGAN